MKIKKLAIVLLASIAIPVTSLAAVCSGKIMAIDTELVTGACLDDLGIVGPKGAFICMKLDSKLDGALKKVESDKLVAKKADDALEKLESFQVTIDKLALKGLVTPTEKYDLTFLVTDATMCVDGLFP